MRRILWLLTAAVALLLLVSAHRTQAHLKPTSTVTGITHTGVPRSPGGNDRQPKWNAIFRLPGRQLLGGGTEVERDTSSFSQPWLRRAQWTAEEGTRARYTGESDDLDL